MQKLKARLFDSVDEKEMSKVFRWQERVNLGPRFGEIPIGWYQAHHCAVMGWILKAVKRTGSLNTRVYEDKGELWVERSESPIGNVKGIRAEVEKRLLRR